MILVDEFYYNVFKKTKDKELQKIILRSNFICYLRFVYSKIFRKKLKGFGFDSNKGLVEYGYALAKFLEDNYKMQSILSDKFVKFQIVNIPPRFGKTETCAVFHSWYMGRNPESHFLGGSYSESLTTESCKKVKYIIKDYYYQWVFPDTIISKDCDTANFFKTTKLGEYYSTGMTGTVTGRGAGNITNNTKRPNGFIFLDDPLKAGDSNSPVVRNAVNETFLSTFLSRCNHPYVSYIIIMQRLHTEDLCGFLNNKFPNVSKRELILPALIKELSLCRANANETFLGDMKAESPEIFWSQFMQTPTLEGDLVFDINKIHILDIEPPKELIFHSFTVADTSMVNKPTADFTVFGHFYVYAVPNWRDYWNNEYQCFDNRDKIVKLLLREIYVTRIDAMNLLDNFEGFLDERLDNATVPPHKVYIETKSSGIALHQQIQTLQQRGGKYNKAGFSLQELGKENLPKELRFAQVSHHVKNEQFEIFGNRMYINAYSTERYILNHLSNITRTKNSSIKDDIADVITYGLANTFLRVMGDGKTDLGQLSYDVINKLTRKIQNEKHYSRY
jgi:hypothetical protein